MRSSGHVQSQGSVASSERSEAGQEASAGRVPGFGHPREVPAYLGSDRGSEGFSVVFGDGFTFMYVGYGSGGTEAGRLH